MFFSVSRLLITDFLKHTCISFNRLLSGGGCYVEKKLKLGGKGIEIDSYLNLEEDIGSSIKISSLTPTSYNGDLKRFSQDMTHSIRNRAEIYIFTSAPNRIKELIDTKFFGENVHIIDNNSNTINRGIVFKNKSKQILL